MGVKKATAMLALVMAPLALGAALNTFFDSGITVQLLVVLVGAAISVALLTAFLAKNPDGGNVPAKELDESTELDPLQGEDPNPVPKPRFQAVRKYLYLALQAVLLAVPCFIAVLVAHACIDPIKIEDMRAGKGSAEVWISGGERMAPAVVIKLPPAKEAGCKPAVPLSAPERRPSVTMYDTNTATASIVVERFRRPQVLAIVCGSTPLNASEVMVSLAPDAGAASGALLPDVFYPGSTSRYNIAVLIAGVLLWICAFGYLCYRFALRYRP